MNILVTGGCGYIGSHTTVELLQEGYSCIVVDNLYNSSKEALNRVKKITGKDVLFYEADIRDQEAMNKIFDENKIDAVIHFAGLKAVGESVKKPLMYYDNNIGGTICLLEVMKEHDVKNILFSSSATVYGNPDFNPIPETAEKRACTNPYGWSKSMIEQILMDLQISDPSWNVTLLRYFNPIGAHPCGLIGEDPKDIPNNLLPYIAQVAIGKRDHLNVFGNDYNTVDGTGVRDYIHVVDLAKGHVLALKTNAKKEGLFIYNLGTGKGSSVFEVLHAFEKACGFEIPYVIAPRRDGDIDEYYGDPTKAKEELGWVAEYNIEDMCKHAWNFQKNNPNGYDE